MMDQIVCMFSGFVIGSFILIGVGLLWTEHDKRRTKRMIEQDKK